MASENTDDLPEAAVELTPSTEPKRKAPEHMIVLKPWQKEKLKQLIEPYIERLPDDTGIIPEDPGQGTARFIDATMNKEDILKLVAPQLSFPITMHNVTGIFTGFFGKLVGVSRGPRPGKGKGALTDEQRSQLDLIASKLGLFTEIDTKVRALASQLAGLQEVIEEHSRIIGTLEGRVTRIDHETVKMEAHPGLDAARNNKPDRPEAGVLKSFADIPKAKTATDLRDKYRAKLTPTKE